MTEKHIVGELAIFGGPQMFSTVKPTSNLVRPDLARFLDLSQEILQTREYTSGCIVKRLEQRLATLHETSFCVAYCSGFWSLAMAAQAIALPGRDEMILPSLTYRRMADIAAWIGLKPHFCEVETDSLAISKATALKCINASTALIVGVHPMVNICDVEGLVSLAEEADIPLLFDSVESVYEAFLGHRAGRFGAAEVFSIGASKLINGFEGGYVTTNDAHLAHRLRANRDQVGLIGDGVGAVGVNVRMNELHAAMALAALDDLEDQVLRNRQRYLTYQRLLATLDGIRLVEFDERFRPAYKNILIEVLDSWPLSRDDTVAILNEERILARAYYDGPLHLKTMTYPHVPAKLPVTERLAERFILLPCGQFVDHADIVAIIGVLRFIRDNASDISTRLRKAALALNVNF